MLKDNGMLITTVISKYGLGFVYITMAKLLRGINKYYYHLGEIIKKLKATGFSDVKIIKLNSWLHVPWAYMVVAE